MLISYRGDPAVKAALLAQLQGHFDADEIEQGVYWVNGRGCAVGCTVHDHDHALYEPRYGIPEMLAHLEDRIFEGLPLAEAKEWPLRFAEAVPVGVDLSRTGWQFLHWLVAEELPPLAGDLGDVRAVLDRLAAALGPATRGGPVDVRQVRDATPTWLAWGVSPRLDSIAVVASELVAVMGAPEVPEPAGSAAAAAADAAAFDAAGHYRAAVAGATYRRQADKLVELLGAAGAPA